MLKTTLTGIYCFSADVYASEKTNLVNIL